jgi:hypothetical protein
MNRSFISTDHAPFLSEALERLFLGIRFAHTRDLTFSALKQDQPIMRRS